MDGEPLAARVGWEYRVTDTHTLMLMVRSGDRTWCKLPSRGVSQVGPRLRGVGAPPTVPQALDAGR